MGFRACEVDQGGSVTFLGHDPEIELQAARQPDRHLRVAPREHLAHAFIRRQTAHNRFGVGAGDEHIDVTHGFQSAAETAGHDHLPDAGGSF